MHLIWKFCCVLLVVQIARCQNASGAKTSEFLKQKFANYDKAVRPNFGEKPVQVTMSGYVLDIFDINEKNQEFTVNLYLRHEWRDQRLEFTETEAGTPKLVLNKEYADKIWRVDSFIVNERESRSHDLLTDNQFTRISTDGTVLISTRYTIRASCIMELGWFPFDRHTCPIVIESSGDLIYVTLKLLEDGHNAADLVYRWKTDEYGNKQKAVTVSKETTSIQFSISAINCRDETVAFGQKSFSRIAVEFFLVRASNRYVHEVFLPATLLTCISFITLFHAAGTAKSRLHLSIFIEGLVIILMALSAKTMPPVSYQTALDFYLVICLLTVTCVVIVNVAICLMLSSTTDSNGVVRLRSVNEESTNVEDDGKEVLFGNGPILSNRTSRVFTLFIKLRLFIPMVFVVFNALYWLVVMIGSSFFPEDFLILENINNS